MILVESQVNKWITNRLRPELATAGYSSQRRLSRLVVVSLDTLWISPGLFAEIEEGPCGERSGGEAIITLRKIQGRHIHIPEGRIGHSLVELVYIARTADRSWVWGAAGRSASRRLRRQA